MQPESLEVANIYFPSIETFVIKCHKCSQWRIIPAQKKYEEIRAHIIELPFICESGREWRADISCDNPPDITEDGSRLWLNDIPNIPLPPPRWQRLLQFRGESQRHADVYYFSPSSKKKNLRCKKDVKRFLSKHPEYEMGGVEISQFSFKIPKQVPGRGSSMRAAIGIILSLTSPETPTKKCCKKRKRKWKRSVKTSHKCKKGKGKTQVSLKPSRRISMVTSQLPSTSCPNVYSSRLDSLSLSHERMLPIKKRYRQQF